MKTFFLIISILAFLTNSHSQDFWHQTNGPYDGATVLDFLLYEDSTIFLATNEGLIKSTDNGNSWIRINSDKVTCLGKDKINTLYYGIGGHLKRSTDGGNSWTDITILGAAIKDFVIPYKDTIIVGSWDTWMLKPDEVSLSSGVFRSFDYGTTWTQVNNGIQYPGVYEISLLTNGALLVGTSGGGVYKSTNWGDLWIESNNGIPANSQGYRYAESFFEDMPGNIFTGTHSGIYYSTNFGDNWTYRGNGIAYGGPATCIVKDDQGILYAGIDISNGVYYSTNNGNQWYHLGLGHSIYTIGWDSDSRLYAGGLGDGLYSFNPDDTTWTQVYNKGYTPVEVLELSLTKNGNLLASTKWWGFHYTINDGENWEKLNFNGYSDVPMTTINDSIIIVGSSGVYVSNDTGKTWEMTGDYSVSSLFYDTVRQIVYLGSFSTYNEIFGIYTSTDFGQTWTLLHDFNNLSDGHWVNPLHVSKSNQYIFASVRHANHFGSFSRFYRSTDKGENWEVIYESQNFPIIEIVEDYAQNLYATTGSKLLISHDEGITWITRNIPGTRSLSTDFSGRIYRSYSWGIYYSTDEGITWIEIDNSGLQNYSTIKDIIINKSNRIYLATESGVFIGEADSIVLSIGDQSSVINSYELFQNYPNPFNPITTIKYHIPEVSFVTLKVYDVLGSEIATLVNEERLAGTYEVEFDRSRLTSGIYFYRLQAGSFVETKKMVLMK